MTQVAQNALFVCFVLLLVCGFLTDSLWLRIVCFALGIPAAVFWIGWDWFIAILRDGRTYRR